MFVPSQIPRAFVADILNAHIHTHTAYLLAQWNALTLFPYHNGIPGDI
jgi:hypothetical protein